MGGMIGDSRLVRGTISRKVNNALVLSFSTGPEHEVARAVQSAGDGRGGKLGVLFGFKNGGPGTHVLTGANGTELAIVSREQEPTLFRDATGNQVAEAIRGDTSTVRRADGSIVFTVDGPPRADGIPDVFPTRLLDASGAALATIEVVRTVAGWSLGRELTDDLFWFGRAGQPLKLPILGTLLAFDRAPTDEEGDLALAVCVDLAIGLRPYTAQMA